MASNVLRKRQPLGAPVTVSLRTENEHVKFMTKWANVTANAFSQRRFELGMLITRLQMRTDLHQDGVDASETFKRIVEVERFFDDLTIVYGSTLTVASQNSSLDVSETAGDIDKQNNVRVATNIRSIVAVDAALNDAVAPFIVTQTQQAVTEPIRSQFIRDQLNFIDQSKFSPGDARRKYQPIPLQHRLKVEKIVTEGIRNNRLVSDIYKDLRPLDGRFGSDPVRSITESRAELIARDQVLTYNANLTQHRHTEAGIRLYGWRTVGDSSVRSLHRQLEKESEKKSFRYDTKPRGGNHPGEDYQCRCWASPDVLSALLAD